MIKQATEQQVNWNKEKSREIVNLSMLQIQPRKIRNFWQTFKFEINKSMIDLAELLKWFWYISENNNNG